MGQDEREVELLVLLARGLVDGDEDRLAVLLGQVREQVDECHRVVGRQAARRLVEEHQRRVGHQLERDVDALALPAREHLALGLADLQVLHRLQTEILDHLLDPAVDLVLAVVVRQAKLCRVLDGLEDRQLGVDDVVLGHVADAPAQGVVDRVEVFAVDAHLPRRRLEIAVEHREERGLARARGAHERDQVAGVRLEGDMVQQHLLGGLVLAIRHLEQEIARLDLDEVARPVGPIGICPCPHGAALEAEVERVGADEDLVARLDFDRDVRQEALATDVRAIGTTVVGDREHAVGRRRDRRRGGRRPGRKAARSPRPACGR